MLADMCDTKSIGCVSSLNKKFILP